MGIYPIQQIHFLDLMMEFSYRYLKFKFFKYVIVKYSIDTLYNTLSAWSYGFNKKKICIFKIYIGT